MKKKVLYISLVFFVLSLYYFMNIDRILTILKTMNTFIKDFLFIFLVVLQIVMAFLPGEPLELAAGYMFGSLKGMVLCLIGSLIGTIIVYYLSHLLKEKIIKVFWKKEHLKKIQYIIKNKHGILLMFILFLIPGTPKDVMTYGVGFMNIKLSHWILLTTIGRIPSIITSTYIADMTANQHYSIAFIVLMISVILFVIGSIIYSKLPCLKGECKNNGT